MPDQPEFGSEAWFSGLGITHTFDAFDPRGAGIARTIAAEALEWAADHTGLFMTKGRDFRKGSEIIRAKAKEIRNG